MFGPDAIVSTQPRPPHVHGAAVGVDDDVADVAGVAGAPVVGRAVEHETPADAGRHHHAEHELGAAARAAPPLTHGHAQAVTAEPRMRTDQLGHPFDDRKALPLQ